MPAATPVLRPGDVHPTSLPIDQLLVTRYPARVPRYQRPYAWDEEHVTDLADDVTKLLPTKTGTRGHFYGGMVAITVSTPKEAQTVAYEIVDGQQRLATFCLLLSGLVRAAERLQKDALSDGKIAESNKFAIYAKEIRDKYLYYQRYDVAAGKEEAEPRLRLSLVDDDKFQALLAGQPHPSPRSSHKLLDQAVRLLDEHLVGPCVDPADRKASLKRLTRLRDAVLHDSFVIHIVGESRANGYRLFAVLNDRGARLTVADLLRSHTLEQLDKHPKVLEDAAAVWDDMLQDGGDAVDAFLTAYHPSLTGRRVSPSDLFDSVRDLLFAAAPATAADAAALLDTVKRLRRDFGWYSQIQDGEWPFPAGGQVTDWHRARLKRLVGALKHDLAAPLLLAVRAVGDEKKFAELVHALELFAFRYKNICNAHATPAAKAYYAECVRLRALQDGQPPGWASLLQDLRKLVDGRAGDALFRSQLAERLDYRYGGSRANIRELLTVLEEYGAWLRSGATGQPSPDTTSVFDLSQVTIEHVYPQNPAVADPVLHPHRNRLGNLSFWSPSDNTTAAALDFAAKKPLYAASSTRLNQDLGALQAWDLAALEQREAELIDEAVMLFRV